MNMKNSLIFRRDMPISLFFRKVYWHLFKVMPCEMILKTKWDEYWKVEKKYWNNHFDVASMNANNTSVIPNRNIFVYWDKGFDNAPDIVKKCYQRLQNHIPEGWRLVALTDKNVSDYIKMPAFVEEMIGGGQMYRAHYSDILRTALLYFYGGIWIDSTCFITKDLPSEILNDDFFMFSTQNSILPYHPSVFENWFIRSDKSNYVLGRMLENVLYYFKYSSNPKSIYFVYFYILAALFKNDAKANVLMDKIMYWGNKDALLILCTYGLNAKYNERLWQQLMSKCFVQKLTYKYDANLVSNKDDILLKHILCNS